MEHFVINIGRQLGSGGMRIAERLAKELGVNYYDKKLLDLTAQESGFAKTLFEQSDEQKSLLESILHLRFSFAESNAADNLYGNILSEESLFKFQSDTIRHLAEKESCIFVGRCADYVLRNHPRQISIFIAADNETRIKAICQRQSVSPEKAEEIIEKADRKRSNYYSYYTDKSWGAAASYDLCINLSKLGEERTFQYILAFVKQALAL